MGNNREARNACFFRGSTIPASAREYIGVPLPLDDDKNNGYCSDDPSLACFTLADCTAASLTGDPRQ